MSLRKRVEKIEGDLYPRFSPFGNYIRDYGLKSKVSFLEKENELLWDNLDALLNYFNLERELVREHLKLKKKK